MTSTLDIVKVLLETAKEKISAIELKEMKQGLRFNIFRILDRFDDEEKGHSVFLAELLNPKGKHGCGNKFINLFIKSLKEEISSNKLDNYISDSEICNTLVDTEKNTKDGRIDILIRSENLLIAIENKIYAEDQPKQLERYKKYLNSFKSENVLIYLTLYGDEPSKSSKGELSDDDYYCISYDFIATWLKSCLSICKINHLNIIIEQYIQCIETLTGKTGTTMTNELSVLLTESNNLGAAITLSKSINHVKTVILNSFISELKNQVDIYVQNSNIKNQTIKLELEKNRYFTSDKIIAQYFTKRSRRPKWFGYAIKVSQMNKPIANFEIRIDSKLYIGVWASDGTNSLNNNIIENYLCFVKDNSSYRENLDTSTNGKIAIKLYNSVNFREFDIQCIKFTDINEIKAYIGNMLINDFFPYIELFIKSLGINPQSTKTEQLPNVNNE